MTNPKLFAEVMHEAYVSGLERDLQEVLDALHGGVDLLLKDVWNADGRIALEHAKRFEELIHELILTVDEDPEAWMKAMLKEAQA